MCRQELARCTPMPCKARTASSDAQAILKDPSPFSRTDGHPRGSWRKSLALVWLARPAATPACPGKANPKAHRLDNVLRKPYQLGNPSCSFSHTIRTRTQALLPTTPILATSMISSSVSVHTTMKFLTCFCLALPLKTFPPSILPGPSCTDHKLRPHTPCLPGRMVHT